MDVAIQIITVVIAVLSAGLSAYQATQASKAAKQATTVLRQLRQLKGPNMATTPPASSTPPASPSSYPPFPGPLRLGSTGPDVVKLQSRLQARGYFLEDADGIFGSLTEHAVKAFQDFAGLTSDGIVGAKTHAALYTLPITPPSQ